MDTMNNIFDRSKFRSTTMRLNLISRSYRKGLDICTYKDPYSYAREQLFDNCFERPIRDNLKIFRASLCSEIKMYFTRLRLSPNIGYYLLRDNNQYKILVNDKLYKTRKKLTSNRAQKFNQIRLYKSRY